MREHNFQICTTRKDNNPAKQLWECALCDTIVSIRKEVCDVATVNRFMANRMPCLDPMIKPLDEVIDNRTTIIKPDNGIIKIK